MALTTSFTRSLSIEHPIVSAPMGGAAGGALAAAVSGAGGLGLVGGAYGDPAWLTHELEIVAAATDRPWGVGFLTFAIAREIGAEVLELALRFRPAAVMLSFGDPRPYADRVRAAGARLILQVTDLAEAELAAAAGADAIVAQGGDAGGHGGRHTPGTMSFVPAVVDLVAPVPVLAAGGIGDGRGLAAALALGAAGALIGTRFQASHESLATPATQKALLDARGGDTERNAVLDIARGAPWPDRYDGRALRNAFVDEWRGREAELRRDEAARAAYRDRPDLAPVWAGQAVDLVTSIEPAAALVAAMAADAERRLRQILAG